MEDVRGEGVSAKISMWLKAYGISPYWVREDRLVSLNRLQSQRHQTGLSHSTHTLKGMAWRAKQLYSPSPMKISFAWIN